MGRKGHVRTMAAYMQSLSNLVAGMVSTSQQGSQRSPWDYGIDACPCYKVALAKTMVTTDAVDDPDHSSDLQVSEERAASKTSSKTSSTMSYQSNASKKSSNRRH